jgi:hypothetical protein
MLRRLAVLLFASAAPALAAAQSLPFPLPFSAEGSTPAAPWRVAGLPQQTKPFTQFSVVEVDGVRALRIEAKESYGNLVYPVRITASSAHLAWQWRMEKPIEASDLRTRAGDDTSVKVCVFFDLPIENIPFTDRQILRIARSKAAEDVPAATVCYVWDANLPAGTMLDNAFTRRMRYIVVRSGTAPLRQWMSERRNVAADFVKLFGAESATVPPIIAVAIGADADNTRSHSVAYVGSLVLEP